MLQVDKLVGGYGGLQVLHEVSLEVAEGEIVSLLGANGAGKTTLLKTISGLLPTFSGDVRLFGEPIGRMAAARRVAHGLAHVPEGRGILHTLSVKENLHLGVGVRRDAADAIAADEERVLSLFPPIRDALSRPAGSLSGGQQQMLAIARAVMMRPKILMVDELSFGLAPALVQQLFSALLELRASGISFLLVEQASDVLRISDRTVVLKGGRVTYAGPSTELLDSSVLRRSYFGTTRPLERSPAVASHRDHE